MSLNLLSCADYVAIFRAFDKHFLQLPVMPVDDGNVKFDLEAVVNLEQQYANLTRLSFFQI